jgi:pimeloyl-ACP methyl ester carboxylesterase
MARAQLRDIVVVLPGITGSLLQREGKDVWAPSVSAVLGWARSGGNSLNDLKLPDDGGIVATSLIERTQIVPGLLKVDGYTALFEMVRSRFNVVEPAADPLSGNLHAFPYDWRQDNRKSAALLESFVGERLNRWRKATDEPDAKAILLAHSMGGLVSRYWLECLGGWRDCRALITFGTPHRGSLNALDFLANGYKKMFIDLTEAMRSFPSVYQLLPIYEALTVEDTLHRVGELTGVPGINAPMAADALDFHREISTAVDSNRQKDEYLEKGYAQIPVVGTRQPTKQSAKLLDGTVTVSAEPLKGIDPQLSGGDGTVPRVSATPIELSDDHRETFRPERHSSL